MVFSFIHGISCQLSEKSVEEFSSFQNWAVEIQIQNPIRQYYSTIVKNTLEYNLLLNHDNKEL